LQITHLTWYNSKKQFEKDEKNNNTQHHAPRISDPSAKHNMAVAGLLRTRSGYINSGDGDSFSMSMKHQKGFQSSCRKTARTGMAPEPAATDGGSFPGEPHHGRRQQRRGTTSRSSTATATAMARPETMAGPGSLSCAP
jgi:hypothetical protein